MDANESHIPNKTESLSEESNGTAECEDEIKEINRKPIKTHEIGNQKGYDIREWVKIVVLPRIKRTQGNTDYIFPDPIPDFYRFSRLHSWYKHFLNRPGKVYPILRISQDPSNDDRLNNPNKKGDNELHWAFIQDHILFDVHGFSSGYCLEMLPWKIMKDHAIYLSDDFYDFNLDRESDNYHINQFFAQCLLQETSIIVEHIRRILLEIDPDPPSNRELNYFSCLDEGYGKTTRDKDTLNP